MVAFLFSVHTITESKINRRKAEPWWWIFQLGNFIWCVI